jgi:hypothetical protein
MYPYGFFCALILTPKMAVESRVYCSLNTTGSFSMLKLVEYYTAYSHIAPAELWDALTVTLYVSDQAQSRLV